MEDNEVIESENNLEVAEQEEAVESTVTETEEVEEGNQEEQKETSEETVEEAPEEKTKQSNEDNQYARAARIRAEKEAEKKKNTGKEMFVGVTRVLSDNESKVFFEKVKGQYPEMDIKIPFLTVMETLQYKPAESAAKVQCPVLVVIAGQDSVNPPEQGRALYDAVASGTKELYEEADACHYDIYEGAFFERVAAVQTQWFKKHL